MLYLILKSFCPHRGMNSRRRTQLTYDQSWVGHHSAIQASQGPPNPSTLLLRKLLTSKWMNRIYARFQHESWKCISVDLLLTESGQALQRNWNVKAKTLSARPFLMELPPQFLPPINNAIKHCLGPIPHSHKQFMLLIYMSRVII